MDKDSRFKYIAELGDVMIFRERPIHIWQKEYSSTGEVKRRIQVMNEKNQLPPERIRLFILGKELLDDVEKLIHVSYPFIDVLYGDEQAVHIRDWGDTWTVGVQSSDLVQTLEAKCRYWTNCLQLNGEKLDTNRSISSYNITEGTVLESHMCMWPCDGCNDPITSAESHMCMWPCDGCNDPITSAEILELMSSVPLPPAAEDEQHDSEHNDWINNAASTIKGFGGSLRSLTRVLSHEHLKSLAQRVGKPALEMMASSIIGLLKEGGFGIPDILQRASDNILSDQDLVGIADATGGNWQLLTHALGLTQARIDQIVLDNNTTVIRVFRMLKRWATENTDGPKAGTLLRAMWDCRSLTVTWETIFQMFA